MMTLFGKFKKIVEPLQLWLMSQGRCVGCGKDLKTGSKAKKGKVLLATCECKRSYVYDEGKKTYRRALLNEIT